MRLHKNKHTILIKQIGRTQVDLNQFTLARHVADAVNSR